MRRCHDSLTRPAAAGCYTSTGPEAASRILPVARKRNYIYSTSQTRRVGELQRAPTLLLACFRSSTPRDSLVLATSPIRCNCASTTNELLFNCEPMQHAVQHGVLSLRPILQRARVVQAQSQWSGDGGGAGICNRRRFAYAAGCCTSTGPEAASRILPVARIRRYTCGQRFAYTAGHVLRAALVRELGTRFSTLT